MSDFNRALILGTLLLLGGCATQHNAMFVPAAVHRTTADTASGLPGDTASGLPGDTASGLPGDTASGLPGDTASGLPGATFSCAPAAQAGEARCTLALNANVAPHAAGTPGVLLPGLHPDDLTSVYALTSPRAGGTVAIVDAYDDAAAEADLAVYRGAFGLAPCTTSNGCFTKLNQRGEAGPYPAPNSGWAQETSLDVEMVSAICPSCKIILIEADSALIDDLGASVDAAARLQPDAISNSYYAPEWASEQDEEIHYGHPGIAITVSSGDLGRTSYPAASPSVTAVGGTSLVRNAQGWQESTWRYGGHGCSAYLRKPDWQRLSTCHMRSAVDLAAVADPQTGVSMFAAQSGGWLVAGGTSVGAPLVAAAYALSGNPQGPAYSYRHLSGFRPLSASLYDPSTGLGSPQGLAGL